MANPENLKYTKEHEWVRLEGDTAVMGITDFAQKQLTDIVFVELPEKGKKAERGKQLCVVESVKSVSDVFAPVSGNVAEVNEKLKDSPEIVNKDPYGNGWMVKIRIANKSELNELMSAKQYEEHTRKG